MTIEINRRNLLKGIGGLGALSAFGVGGIHNAVAKQLADSATWRQAKGTTIRFISENTPPTTALRQNLAEFKQLTGITVEIAQYQMTALTQKVALDMGSGRSTYDVIYADPYQILAPFHRGLTDLNQFVSDAELPSVPGGLRDFIPTQLAAAGRYVDHDKLYALPYDCPTMIWFYRKDLFAKYKNRMTDDLGFDPTPSGKITWDQYYQIAQWFNGKHVPEVAYGTGHMAQQADSLQSDFSNFLPAFGGGYFNHSLELGLYGSNDPGPCTLGSDHSIAAAQFYKKLLDIAHPGSKSWDWTGVADAFGNGSFAMMPEFNSYASSLERSDLQGKIGYSILPTGPARSANVWGGTGIGINGNASDKAQRAAWLFLVWATAPKTQLAGLESKVGGGTPTRESVYQMDAVKKGMHAPTNMPNMLPAEAVQEAWKKEHIALRPKVPHWNNIDTVLYTNLSKMLSGNTDPAAIMKQTARQVDSILG